MRSIGVFAVFAVVAAGILQAAAHHSGSMFDMLRSEALKGRVVELRWVNPHVTLTVRGTLPDGFGEIPGVETVTLRFPVDATSFDVKVTASSELLTNVVAWAEPLSDTTDV